MALKRPSTALKRPSKQANVVNSAYNLSKTRLLLLDLDLLMPPKGGTGATVQV